MPNLQLAPRPYRRRIGLGDVDITKYLTPPQPSHYPNPLNDIQASAQADLQLAEKGVQSTMQQDLEAIAQKNGDVAAARAAYDQYGAKAINAFHAIQSIAEGSCNGQASCFSQFSPVISFALAPLLAAVPAAGIAVAAALAVMDVIAGLVVPKPPECDWNLPGGACVTGRRPAGPADPTWTGWEQFMKGAQPVLADQVIFFHSRTIACEMATLQQLALLGGIPAFFLAYYKALQRAGEYAINGYQMPKYGDTLAATLNAWNAVHGPPSVALIETPGWKGSNGNCLSGGPPNDPNGSTFLGSLLAGDIDNFHWFSQIASQQGKPSPMVNLGPSAISQLIILNAGLSAPGGKRAPTGMSTGAKIATGTAVAAGVTAAGMAVYARFTHQPFLSVVRKSWQSTGGRVVSYARRKL